MSSWGEVKQIINKDIGTADFLPIDELILLSQELIYSPQVAKNWIWETTPPENIEFVSATNGNCGLLIRFMGSQSCKVKIYHNQTEITYTQTNDVSAILYQAPLFDIKRGDLISINFENAENVVSGGNVSILGEYANHYGLREMSND